VGLAAKLLRGVWKRSGHREGSGGADNAAPD
jgi:hypothetical protein